ncbi:MULTISPECIES: undecaprenyl-phosphate glucose phosphotransferase [Burkholderia]|uniref:Undecaprenyl-phosphate glucose phosphotransferase n=1 Tax=Burkholderia contaminans TaxID=488447 RepID=A0A2S5E3T9_9BURK|nr:MULTISPECIES: undecaprenyl-phosphate glucose phosphotransferase [Burkholderia]EKS9798734.1 undecaprenyl-phosphate glucose phosphotransferase [Burkholderia cepacia]EKS9803174.1 undecaprenyl-phosphate glucose phosphotransferase [Burkholderia cepacia]EKS9810658.1 undecaprenyl-phosphate glucose phosphotransferase [Burkholderia cepacia]EKS9819611.1 undecaprenyl-phosphate glucose phosphotransferase [Burkholderia cepacia]EKS9827229.1 undecaprenyl-phosphate glucose phosphotransferase [Burkholderia 
MHSFDYASYGSVVRGKEAWFRLADAGLLAGTAWAAKSWLGDSPYSTADAVLIAIALVCALVLFPLVGLYGVRGQRMPWRRVWLAPAGFGVALCVGAAAVVAFDARSGATLGWVVGWFVLSAVALIVSQALWRWLDVRAAARNARRKPVALVGHRERCLALAGRDARNETVRLPVAAILDLSAGVPAGETGDTAIHRDLGAFVECVRRAHVGEVWIGLPLSEADRIGAIVRAFDTDLVDIRFMPDLAGMTPLHPSRPSRSRALDLVASPLSARALAAKAVFDRVFAALALIAIAPAMGAIAIAVKCSSPGPVLFRQQRRGAYGRIFTIYKFRTMRRHDTDEADEVRQATRGDPRVTRVGALLRRTSLDELPQFLNVLKGDMSVVGPRPHAVEHDHFYQHKVDGYIQRYRIKPGITGWAQVNGHRGETDRVEKMQKRVEYDLYYLNNWSFSLDMRIVAATVLCGFTHRNAY